MSGTSTVPPAAFAPPPSGAYTALAISDIADALAGVGALLAAAAEPTPAKRESIALRLEAAAAHVRGRQFDPPTAELRKLWAVSPRLAVLAGEIVDAWCPSAPEPTEALAELRALLASFSPSVR